MGPLAQDETSRAAAPPRREASRRAVSNLLRMGHCAPSVARSLADLGNGDDAWLVRLAAGLPGGIGNTRGECGGVTGALLVLGLRAGGHRAEALPMVVEHGQALCRRFEACHGSLACRDILCDRRLPLPCVGVVRRAPALLADALAADAAAELAPGTRAAQRRLLAHLAEVRFHCAHAVLRAMAGWFPVTPALLDATAGFVGGTAGLGLTCSALTAGVMGLGLAAGEIEDSRARVARMLAVMALGGDALRDDLNAFNPSIRRGHRLARWFERELGSTRCRELTGVDLSREADVERFVQGGQTARCARIAERVAERAGAMLRPLRRHPPHQPRREP